MAETKKYVQIKKSPCRSIWYADKIGSIFPSLGTRENAYKVDSPDRALYIRKEDAELIITENRRPKTDERVLITEGLSSSGDYKTGDICTVRRVVDIYGTITVKEHSNFVIAREYEVIVNSEVKNEEADEMKIDLNAMGYDELLAHGDAVMEAIKKRTFQEGFQAAKQVQRKLAKMKTSINTQARRDEIVEQAKADVEKLANKYGYYYAYGRNTKAEFIVNCEKRTVVTILRWIADGQIVARGIAKAAPSDCFNVHIGRAIALRRALGLTVPDEYLNAPQPTEVRVGDVVRGKYADYYYQLCREGELGDDSYEAKIREIADGKYRYVGGGYDFIDNADLTIIDDSREGVGE
ncbi:hypothetical protein [Bacillus amyloliquefaciens]|uniref:hypothetical protein n=1 Tax=Bacillus amyloliquefaciens TaxID=1390 RepID=UPI002E1CE874|nr:hypothetical protein [Bacillus amyloliquefaciens]